MNATTHSGKRAACIAGAILLALTAISARAADSDHKPYQGHIKCAEADGAKKCKVDLWLVRGYRAFSQCQVCHGLDGNGSSFAPSLVDKLKEVDRTRFDDVVTNGYTGQVGVMPAWKENPNVMKWLDHLYAYLKARADAVIPPGQLARFDR